MLQSQEVPLAGNEFSNLNTVRVYGGWGVLFGQDAVAHFHTVEVAFEATMAHGKAIEEDG